MSRRYSNRELRDWIAAQPGRVTAADLQERTGLSLGRCYALLDELRAPEPAPPAPVVPLPRWCQPQQSRPRYRIDEAFPRDPEVLL